MNIKRWLPLLFMLLTCPAWATWSLVQTVNNAACSSVANTCTLTVTSTGAGNLLVVFGRTGSANTFTAGSAGGTWVFPSGCTNSLDSGCGYVLSSTAGATTITITRSGSSGSWSLQFREFHYTAAAGIAVESVPNAIQISGNTASNPITGPTPTVTGTSDVVIASAFNTGVQAVNGVDSPYGDFTLVNGSGCADQLNANTATAATFTTSASSPGTFNLAVLSFKENVATVNVSTVGKVSTVGNVSSE